MSIAEFKVSKNVSEYENPFDSVLERVKQSPGAKVAIANYIINIYRESYSLHSDVFSFKEEKLGLILGQFVSNLVKPNDTNVLDAEFYEDPGKQNQIKHTLFGTWTTREWTTSYDNVVIGISEGEDSFGPREKTFYIRNTEKKPNPISFLTKRLFSNHS